MSGGLVRRKSWDAGARLGGRQRREEPSLSGMGWPALSQDCASRACVEGLP